MGNTYKANQRQREAKYEELEARRRDAKRKTRKQMCDDYASRVFGRGRKALPDGEETKK
jgi:hypothetical protein